MSYAYIRAGVVVHIAGVDSEPVDGAHVIEMPNGGVVEVGYSYADSVFLPPSPDTLTTITKTHFLLTFTSAERVKARALRATDPTLDDFWLILEDPNLTTINLALPSLQNGVENTLMAVKSAGLTTLDVAARKAEILAGKLQ